MLPAHDEENPACPACGEQLETSRAFVRAVSAATDEYVCPNGDCFRVSVSQDEVEFE